MSERIIKVTLLCIGGGGTLLFATKDYTTSPDATELPNTFVEGRLLQAGLLPVYMYGPDKTRGDMEIGAGAITLGNSDGKLDYLIDYTFDGFAFGSYEVDSTGKDIIQMAYGYNEQPVCEGSDKSSTIVFAVRDVRHAWDIDLLPIKYAGNNALPLGEEGVANDLKGKPKPRLTGTVSNVQPICVNTSKLIYQLEGQTIGFNTGWTVAAFDRRVALTQGANYVSVADMETNAPAAGNYRVLPAGVSAGLGGYIRLGSTPDLLTCDVVNPAAAGGSTLSVLLKEFVGTTAPIGEVYLTNDPTCGAYYTENISKLAAVNELMRSVQAFVSNGWNPSYLGVSYSRNWVSQLTLPADIPYLATAKYDPPLQLAESDLKSFSFVAPQDPERGLPVWQVTVFYKRNYTPMDIAGAYSFPGGTVGIVDRTEYQQEWKSVVVSDSSVLTNWPNAIGIEVYTAISNSTDATTEANRLLTLYKTRRKMYRAVAHGKSVRENAAYPAVANHFQLGARVTVTIARFGLDSGKTFIVTGIVQDNVADTYTITLWG